MNKNIIIAIVACMLLLIIGLASLGGMYVSYNNKYIGIKNLMVNKIKDNKTEYDNMWKKIKGVAQVTEKDRSSLMEIFVGHADARTNKGGQPVMNWIKESVPTIDSSTFKNLQNIIISSRDSWTMRQKELIDMKREMDNLLEKIPSCWFLSSKESIEIKVVTSTKTEKAFESGVDDDVDVF